MNQATVKIPYSVARITHLGGYWERVTEILQTGATNYEAWNKIETELLEYGFPPRYTSFGSFRTVKCDLKYLLKAWKPKKAFLKGYLHSCQLS